MNSSTQHLVIKSLKKKDGAIGYVIAWALGVPASLLLIIFLIRGF